MPLLRSLLAAGDGAPSQDSDSHYSPTMPVIAIFIILLLGLSGSLIPPLINFYLPKFNLNARAGFRFFNGLAAGLVLGVGYIHSIPDSIESFSESFAESSDDNTDPLTAGYAWGGLCAMIGSLATFLCEEFVHRNIGRFGVVHGHHHDHDHSSHSHSSHSHSSHSHSSHSHNHSSHSPNHSDNSHNHEKSHGNGGEGDGNGGGETEKKVDESMNASIIPPIKELEVEVDTQAAVELNYYTELYVLLFGLSFHSIFVGIALGVSGNDWGLFAAIVFHQFFEGLALGARVARAGFRSKSHIWFLDIVYALSAPIGIAIGIGIESAIEGNTRAYSQVNGVFQGLSGGILIYVALIHMMKEEMERPEFKAGGLLLYIMYSGFLLGAGAMAVIGIWA